MSEGTDKEDDKRSENLSHHDLVDREEEQVPFNIGLNYSEEEEDRISLNRYLNNSG